MQSQQDYKKLKAYWYKKLKDDGFEDIEDTEYSGRPLKAWHSSRFYFSTTSLQIESTREYHTMAERFFDLYNFKNELHVLIWALHADGRTCREIAYCLNKKKSNVSKIIVSLRKRMRLGY